MVLADMSPQKFHKLINGQVSQQIKGPVGGVSGHITAKVSQTELQSFAAKVLYGGLRLPFFDSEISM